MQLRRGGEVGIFIFINFTFFFYKKKKEGGGEGAINQIYKKGNWIFLNTNSGSLIFFSSVLRSKPDSTLRKLHR